LNPDYERTYQFLYFVYQEKGMFEEAMKAFDEFYSHSAANGQRSAEELQRFKALNAKSVEAYRRNGPDADWQSRIAFCIAQGDGAPGPLALALTYARLRKPDQAFTYLEKSFNNHDLSLLWMKVSPD
jgi:tetratricopeptide (TPR) repeat protein